VPKVKELRVIFKKTGVMKDSNINQAAPDIDISECSDCESCVELCPSVFRINEETGIIEAVELSQYPEEEIREAISYCPKDCITWEGGG